MGCTHKMGWHGTGTRCEERWCSTTIATGRPLAWMGTEQLESPRSAALDQLAPWLYIDALQLLASSCCVWWLSAGCTPPQLSESVKCRFSKCRFSVLNLKFDFISDGGCTREKQIQKALGSLPPCRNRCRFSESAICSSRVHPPSGNKIEF